MKSLVSTSAETRVPSWSARILPALLGINLLAVIHASGQNLGAAGNFALLALDRGDMTINSGSHVEGNIGYSRNTVSTVNQKVEDFTGGAYVHSQSTFSHTPSNFLPSEGILSGPAVDLLLDQANHDVMIFAAATDLLTSNRNLGFLDDNDSVLIESTGALNVIDIDGIDYNSDSLTLRSRSGFEDRFIIRVTGDMRMSDSSILLDGLTAAKVLFYFPNASSILLNKSGTTFRGTILAPHSEVEYHNPADYQGAILAKSISVHSDFRLAHAAFVPEPGSLLLCMTGSLLILRRRRG